MKLEQHERLRSAESSWIGQVPKNWQIRRIKDVFKNFGSGSTPKSSNPVYYEDGTINWLNTTDLNNGYITKTKSKITTTALETLGMRVYPVNSLAIAMYGQGKTRGTVGLFKIATTTNQAACVMYKSFIAHEQFILWWFIHKYADIRAINVGATQPNMNQDFVKFLALALPPIHDQILIANYLNTKTKFIDSSIKIIRSKISTYEKLRKTLITEAVCRGIDPNVPNNPSGVAWLGDIPAHWEIRRLKDVGKIVLGKMLNNTPTENYHLKPYLKSKNIAWLNPIVDNIEYMYFNVSEMSSYRVKKDDLLLSEGGEVGKTCIWNDELDECYIQNSVHKITISKRNNPRYFLYASFLMGATGYYNSIVNQVSIKHLTWEKLNNVPVAVPPLAEQNAIAAHLDQKTQKIDSIVTNLKAQIETLKELRKTLINEVVTGKLKVTE